MSALLDYLRVVNGQVGRCPAFDGILTEGHGAPSASTPIGYLFYADADTETVYLNNTRTEGVIRPTGAAWVQAESADVLAESGTILTADT